MDNRHRIRRPLNMRFKQLVQALVWRVRRSRRVPFL
jgi:hypothetical protein